MRLSSFYVSFGYQQTSDERSLTLAVDQLAQQIH